MSFRFGKQYFINLCNKIYLDKPGKNSYHITLLFTNRPEPRIDKDIHQVISSILGTSVDSTIINKHLSVY